MSKGKVQRKQIGFTIIIIIGLLLGLVIKRMALGMIIGIVFGLIASGMMAKDKE
jgi:hypothetical protein